MHVLVKDLPGSIQAALRSVGYAKRDIAVEGATRVSPFDAGGDGRRAFLVLLDLVTGATKHTQGSWGGANAYNPGNQVDLDSKEYVLPEGGAVIKGSEGNGVFATLYLNPANLAKLLPQSSEDLTDKQRSILNAYAELKSGPYRREALEQARATEADIRKLVEMDLLKSNATGVQITTSGKNARKR